MIQVWTNECYCFPLIIGSVQCFHFSLSLSARENRRRAREIRADGNVDTMRYSDTVTVNSEIIFNNLIMCACDGTITTPEWTPNERMETLRKNNNICIKMETRKRHKEFPSWFHFSIIWLLLTGASVADGVVVSCWYIRSSTLTAWHKWDCSIFTSHFSRWNLVVRVTSTFAPNMKCSHHFAC